jgi:hypothetical protein
MDFYQPIGDVLRWAGARLVRPKLVISYDEREEPFLAHDPSNNNVDTAFYRLDVKNVGKSSALNCQGFITSICQEAEEQNLLGRPVELKWGHEIDFRSVSVEPGESRKLDLFYVTKSATDSFSFFMKTPGSPVGISPRKPMGRYRVGVRLNSDSAQNLRARILVTVEGFLDANIELEY